MNRNGLLAIIFLLALDLLPGSARAATQSVALGYDVYIGGIRLLALEIEGDLAPTSYDMTIRFKTEGFLGRMMPFMMEAFSRGAFIAEATRPEAAGQRNVWAGRERRVDLLYHADGAVEARAEPPPDKDGRDPVSAEERRHTVDLVSAILALLKSVEAGAPCAKSVPVFDGRRRYDFLAVEEGRERVVKSSYSSFAGEAVACRIAMNEISGFWNKRAEDEQQGDRTARVLVASPGAGLMPLPVRLEMDTRIGGLRAHLARTRVNGRPAAASARDGE